MKTYNVSCTIKKIDGFGWLSFLVKNAKCTGILVLKATKDTFDKYSGTLSYTATIGSVSGFLGISMTNLIVSKLGTKTAAGELIITGPSLGGTGPEYSFSANVSQAWNKILGKVNIKKGNISVSSEDIEALLVSDDGQYEVEVTSTTTTATATPPVVPPSTVSGELVDPPYSQSWMDQHGRYQEVGIEQTYKIIVRCCVYRPSVNGWWMLTDPFVGKVKRVGNQITCPDFVYQGYAYHIRGWKATGEPGTHEANPKLDYVGDTAPYGTKWMICEIRKAV